MQIAVRASFTLTAFFMDPFDREAASDRYLERAFEERRPPTPDEIRKLPLLSRIACWIFCVDIPPAEVNVERRDLLRRSHPQKPLPRR